MKTDYIKLKDIEIKLTNNIKKESLERENYKGKILFKYKILLETDHDGMMALDKNLEDILQKKDLLNNLPNSTINWLKKFLKNLSLEEQKIAIKKHFIKYFCEQQTQLEFALTPDGNQFDSLESKEKYEECITEYSDTLDFLQYITKTLKLRSCFIQVKVSSNVSAKNAQQEIVNGPTRCIPIF